MYHNILYPLPIMKLYTYTWCIYNVCIYSCQLIKSASINVWFSISVHEFRPWRITFAWLTEDGRLQIYTSSTVMLVRLKLCTVHTISGLYERHVSINRLYSLSFRVHFRLTTSGGRNHEKLADWSIGFHCLFRLVRLSSFLGGGAWCPQNEAQCKNW